MSATENLPEWAQRFLTALRSAGTVAAAARVSGLAPSTVYKHRAANAAFAAAMAEARGGTSPQGRRDAMRNGNRRSANRIGSIKTERFLEALAETSNVTAAAAVAQVETGAIYKLRRSDAEFSARWYAALAEGYDNLEMELLQHLRSGETPEAAAASPKRKFDTATALRCLTAHREAVSREKGRRTLAQEVSTIAEINAKIDALRRQRKDSDRAIAAARKANAARRKTTDGEG